MLLALASFLTYCLTSLAFSPLDGYRMPSVATSEPPSPASLSVPNWGAGSESACGCWSLDRYSARWPVW
ncbi:Uncharacterised protein [Mycobacterium tuberculosis]|nr:Uncharacterised protein [Mycobacterium tuberculosis]